MLGGGCVLLSPPYDDVGRWNNGVESPQAVKLSFLISSTRTFRTSSSLSRSEDFVSSFGIIVE